MSKRQHAFSQQTKTDLLNLDFLFKKKLFILMGNKNLIRRMILWKRINLPSVISTETQFLVMETEFLALIASNTFGNSNQ